MAVAPAPVAPAVVQPLAPARSGVRSNASAIGARVIVRYGGRTQAQSAFLDPN